VKTSRLQKLIAALLLVAALALLVTGGLFKRKVFEKEDEFAQLGPKTFMRLSDRAMVVDATFTGVVRDKDGRLTSTYDRNVPRGKKACPT
jgi:hypothetical protein